MNNEFEDIIKKITNEAQTISLRESSSSDEQKKLRNRMNRVCHLIDEYSIPYPPRLHLISFLNIPKEMFVEHAYRMVLLRPPDPAGKRYFESLMFSGQLSPLEVIGALRYSAEGKRVHIHIPGLLWLYIAIKIRKKIWLLGYILQLPFLLFALPVILKYPSSKVLWRNFR
jgi:hypothetical protein